MWYLPQQLEFWSKHTQSSILTISYKMEVSEKESFNFKPLRFYDCFKTQPELAYPGRYNHLLKSIHLTQEKSEYFYPT